MNYDPMMDADEYHRCREVLLSEGYVGAGNYWYKDDSCWTLRSAMNAVLFRRRMRHLRATMDSLRRNLRRASEQILRNFRANPAWRRLAGIPDTPSNLYLQLSRYPMLESGEGKV